MGETDVLITALKRNSLDDGPGIRTTVFFKGCPLSCTWCQNPETKSALQQIVYEREHCTGCSSCMRSCGEAAISIHEDGSYPIDRQKCGLTNKPLAFGEQPCDRCVSACPSQALHFGGTAYTTDELCRKLLKDAVFYRNSNGGVTLSGGEPTLHLHYAGELAGKLKKNGIHICLQTCGLYNRALFEQKLLPFLDLVHFDIKLFDNTMHQKYCGVSNETILQNLESLFQGKKVQVLPRIPLVPGITAERENLIEIKGFLYAYGVQEIGLLPYNPLWLSKLPGIGARAEYDRTEWMTVSEKDEIKEIFRDFSFRDF